MKSFHSEEHRVSIDIQWPILFFSDLQPFTKTQKHWTRFFVRFFPPKLTDVVLNGSNKSAWAFAQPIKPLHKIPPSTILQNPPVNHVSHAVFDNSHAFCQETTAGQRLELGAIPYQFWAPDDTRDVGIRFYEVWESSSVLLRFARTGEPLRQF